MVQNEIGQSLIRKKFQIPNSQFLTPPDMSREAGRGTKVKLPTIPYLFLPTNFKFNLLLLLYPPFASLLPKPRDCEK